MLGMCLFLAYTNLLILTCLLALLPASSPSLLLPSSPSINPPPPPNSPPPFTPLTPHTPLLPPPPQRPQRPPKKRKQVSQAAQSNPRCTSLSQAQRLRKHNPSHPTRYAARRMLNAKAPTEPVEEKKGSSWRMALVPADRTNELDGSSPRLQRSEVSLGQMKRGKQGRSGGGAQVGGESC